MPKSSPAATRGDAKRRAIIAAARKSFLEHGFEATSMDAVALAAEVSKRTVYNHFPSKNALFSAVVDELYAGLREDDLGLSLDQPPAQALGVFARRMLVHMRRPEIQGLLRLVIAEQARFPDLAPDYFRLGKGPILALLESYLAARPELEIKDARLAASIFLGSIKEGLFWPHLLGLEPREDTPLIDMAVEAFLKAFGKAR